MTNKKIGRLKTDEYTGSYITEHLRDKINELVDAWNTLTLEKEEEKVKILQKRSDENGCYTANGILICMCGKCKPEDYKLPADFTLKQEEHYRLDGDVVKNGLVPHSPKEEWSKTEQNGQIEPSSDQKTIKSDCSLPQENTHTPDTSVTVENYHAIEKILVDFKKGATYSNSIEKVQSLISQAVQEEKTRIREVVEDLETTQGSATDKFKKCVLFIIDQK